MRVSILGFNQQSLINYPHGQIKLEDVLLLSYIWNAIPSPSMEHIVREDKHYVWLKHDKILEDLPLLHISKDRLKRRLQRLIDLQLVERINLACTNCRGTKSYYGVTINAENLLYTRPGVENNTCSHDRVLKITPEPARPGVENNTSNNKLINNSKLDNKDINKDFDLKHTPRKTQKANLFNECVNEINQFTSNEDVRSELINYLKMRMKFGLTLNNWKGILKKLSNRVAEQDYVNAIKYSTQQEYLGIFNAPDKTYTKKQNMEQLEGIPHDGRYDNENHTITEEVF